MNETLTNLLKIETESLRVQYVTMTSEWARKDYANIERLAATPHPVYQDYVKELDTFHVVAGRSYRNQDHEGQKRYRQACDRRHAAKRIVEKGMDAYVDRQRVAAERHYQDSIVKLAARIERKGMKQDALVLSTSHIGVNIDTTITDGTMTVRAYTIIASGPIQRPHYRYLVK